MSQDEILQEQDHEELNRGYFGSTGKQPTFLEPDERQVNLVDPAIDEPTASRHCSESAPVQVEKKHPELSEGRPDEQSKCRQDGSSRNEDGNSPGRKAEDREDLRLPRLALGGLLAVAISGTIYFATREQYSAYVYVLGIKQYTWTISTLSAAAVMPLSIYWISSLFRLFRATAIKFGGKPLLPAFLATAIFTFLSISTSPFCWSWQYYFYSQDLLLRLPETTLDPNTGIFQAIPYLIWLVTQFSWPAILYARMKESGSKWQMRDYATLLALGTISALPSFLAFSSGFAALLTLWTVSQALLISFFKRKIREQDSGKKQNSSGADELNKSLKDMPSGDDIVLQYHPFAAITRWRKQQEGALNKELKSILIVALPILLVSIGAALLVVKELESPRSGSSIMAPVSNNSSVNIQRILERWDYGPKIAGHLSNLLHRGLKDTVVVIEIDPYGMILSSKSQVNLAPDGNEDEPSTTMLEAIKDLQPLPLPPPYVMKKGKIAARITRLEDDYRAGPWFSVEFAEDPSQFPTEPPKIYDQVQSRKRQVQMLPEESADSWLSTSFLGIFSCTVLGLLGASMLYVSFKPTHIGLSREGWRFLYRRTFNMSNGKYIYWNDLDCITMQSPENSTSPLKENLCFKKRRGDSASMSMGSLSSVEDRELLLKAIEKWAAAVPREATVREALQAPADHSYTELWLQALSAAPKRERLKPLESGLQLRNGTYTILDQIGTGGQGNAYLASSMDGQTVVLKECILPVYVDVNVRRAALEQFENEARLLRQLDHHQIVKLLDFFVEDHRTYLVLEHINGKSLRQIVKESGALPEDKVRSLAAQMCQILSYLHNLRPAIIHRDFTPDNLILSKDGTLKLIDFNVAKQIVESTTSGTVVGKHAYLPPEQFRGRPESASDIYAMGATLYYLLCGKDPEAISCSHPRRANPSLSETINRIVERATALDTAKRYKTIEELDADLMQENPVKSKQN